MSVPNCFNNSTPVIFTRNRITRKGHLPGWRLIVVATLIAGLFSTPDAGATPRTWTNLKGDRITASLKEIHGKEVVLEAPGGNLINYPRWALTPEDQLYISTWAPFLGHSLGAVLQGDLVVLNDEEDTGPLKPYENPPAAALDVVALYFSAGFSPYCREFTPELVNFYKDQQKKHKNFEVILVDSDPSRDAMVEYMKDFEMPWPAVAYAVTRKLPKELLRVRGTGIPNLVLVGRDGKVIADAFQNGEYVGPSVVLETFKTLLQHGVPGPEEPVEPAAAEPVVTPVAETVPEEPAESAPAVDESSNPLPANP